MSLQISRRHFLSASVTLPFLATGNVLSKNLPAPIRIGLITDLHYADKETRGSRHYRESLKKLEEATQAFQDTHVDFVVELGDLIDAAKTAEQELTWLKTINQQFIKMPGEQHYVLGNHCVTTLSKEDFLTTVDQKESYYSFDQGGVHFVILDACFKADGTPYSPGNFHWQNCFIPDAERAWLKSDLAATELPTIVFAHQRIDPTKSHSIVNDAAVRDVLEASKKVLAVFQGHSHKDEHHLINNIHYTTMTAMVEGSGEENSGYSLLTIQPDGQIDIKGFRKQDSYHWPM